MSIATFTHVREVSSEDALHLAENLLKPNTGKKWKTKTAGEKSAYVILELRELQQITGIDIGNEHAAFIEVWVGKAGCPINAYTQILLTSSFMTPLESRNSSNVNRVRFFKTDALVATAQSEKWQLVKIVCTQPFNKHVQYGISFITLHVAAAEPQPKQQQLQKQPTTSTAAKTFFGKFALREESPDSEPENSSAQFSKWKQNANNSLNSVDIPKLKKATDLNISVGSRFPSSKRQSVDDKTKATTESDNEKPVKTRDRNRNDLLFGASDETADTAFKKQWLQKEQEQQKQEKQQVTKDKQTTTPKAEKTASPKTKNAEKRKSTGEANDSASKKRPKHDKAIDATKYRAFNQLLRGVTLVISGIQNPDRANLRTQALELGAKYKTDWTSDCTHLICAFKNTPKYNQVKGKGKIVKRHWIEQCHALKKYLPWRRYALDSQDAAQPESDEEILDEATKPQHMLEEENNDVMLHNNNNLPSTSKEAARNQKQELQQIAAAEDERKYSGSDSDTEDEIERVLNKHKQSKDKDSAQQEIFDVDTEEEEYLTVMRQNLAKEKSKTNNRK